MYRFSPCFAAVTHRRRRTDNFFVIDRAPQTFHKDVIAAAALVGVEDIQCAVFQQSLSHRLQAEVGGEDVGQTLGQHPSAGSVHHGKQIDKARLMGT